LSKAPGPTGEVEELGIFYIEDKSKKGDSMLDLLSQAYDYVDRDKLNESPFLLAVKGTKVSFFFYDPDYHTSHRFYLKNKEYDGFLGLHFDGSGVKVLPQFNTWYPQMKVYDLNGDITHKLSCHALFKFISILKYRPGFNSDSHTFTNKFASTKVGQNLLIANNGTTFPSP